MKAPKVMNENIFIVDVFDGTNDGLDKEIKNRAAGAKSRSRGLRNRKRFVMKGDIIIVWRLKFVV